jgi:sigma-70-like protein
MSTSNTHRAINAVWRIESAKIIAGLARIVRDVGLAEDLAQDALIAALEQWPEQGVPENPGAWLMAAAKHRNPGSLTAFPTFGTSLPEKGVFGNSYSSPRTIRVSRRQV